MTALASADVTITPSASSKRSINSRVKEIECTIAFGDSSKTYPSGGVPLPTTLGAFGVPLPIREIILLTDRNTTTGTHWYADVPNMVLHGWHYGYTPYVIYEEAVTLTSNAGTLKYPPAYIISASGTISATVQPLRPVPSTATLATKEIGVNFTSGAVTTRASDSVSSCYVSYIPQQPAGPFAAANMVSESITLATGNNSLSYQAGAFQFAYQTTATAARLPIGHANASGVLALDFDNGSGATVVSANSAQNTKAATFQYLKRSGFQQTGVEIIDQATISLTSEVKEWGKAAGDYPAGIIIPGMGGQIIGVEASNYLAIYLAGSTATAAVGIAKFEQLKNKITTAETTPQTSIQDTPLMFISSLYTPMHGLAELTANHAPASTTLRALVRF